MVFVDVFIVGKVIERAGQDLSNLLNDSFLFDIGSHTYSHMEILSAHSETKNKFKNELIKTSKLILKHFDKEPLGFCAPGGFYKGLRGYPCSLRILSCSGYPLKPLKNPLGAQKPSGSLSKYFRMSLDVFISSFLNLFCVLV